MEINTNNQLKHYPYPKIGQFRNVVKDVSLRAAYQGKDENGEPIYNNSLPKPKIKFYGTVKLHGTNLGIVLDRVNNQIYFQSRENIITPLKDNAGAASYLASIQDKLWELFEPIQGDLVCVYGEWAGQSIQKGVAISQLPKAAYIFDIKVDGESLQKLQESGKPTDQSSTGDFIKWIREDILKEELDTIVQNGLEVKDLNGPISKAAKDWYFNHM